MNHAQIFAQFIQIRNTITSLNYLVSEAAENSKHNYEKNKDSE